MNQLCFVCDTPATRICIHPDCDENPFLCGDQCKDNKNMAIKLHKHNGLINIVPYQEVIKKSVETLQGHLKQFFDNARKRVNIIKDDLDAMLNKLEVEISRTHSNLSSNANQARSVLFEGGKVEGLQGKYVRELINGQTKDKKNNTEKLLKQLFENRLNMIESEIGKFVIQRNQISVKFYEGGQKLRLQSRFQEALSEYQMSYGLNPEYLQSVFKIGYCLSQLKNYTQSTKYYQKFIQIAPENHPSRSKCFNNMGNIYKNCNWSYLKAVDYYTKAIQIDSSNPNYFNNRGIVHQNTRNLKGAISDYQMVHKLNPLDPQPLFKIGSCHHQLNNYQQSIKYYQKYLQLAPKDHCNMGNCYYNMASISKDHLKDQSKAIYYYTKTIEIDNNNYLSFYNRAEALKNTNKFKDALDDYLASYKLNPNCPQSVFYAGYCYQKLQKYKKAQKYYQMCLEIAPKNHSITPICYCTLGCIYDGYHKDYQKAIEYYDRSIQINSNNEALFNNRGMAFQKLEKLEEAADDYLSAIKLNAKKQYCLNRSRVLKKLGRIAESEKYEKMSKLVVS